MTEPQLELEPLDRPICPKCHAPLIHMALVVVDHIYYGWICNCEPQPEGIEPEILRVRYEWDYAGIIIEESLVVA